MLARKPSNSLVSSGELPDRLARRTVGHRQVPFLLHRGFVGAGAVLLIAAFITDWAYYATALWQWANFSAWLIATGLIVMLVAVLSLLVDFVVGRAGRLNPASFTLVSAAALLSLVNAFVHSRDAWTSVVPQGLLLSAASTLLLVIAGARGWGLTAGPATGAPP